MKATKNVQPLLEKILENRTANHFLSHVSIADSIDDAWQWIKKAPGQEVWSSDGVFIDRFHVLFYTTQSENNVFLREAELKVLEKKLQEIETVRQELDSKLKALQGQRSSVQAERVELDKVIRREEMKLAEYTFALGRAKGDFEKLFAEDKQLENELTALLETTSKLLFLIVDLQQKHSEAKSKGGSIHTSAATIKNELEQHTTIYKQEQRDLQDKESAFHKVSEENRKLIHTLNVLEVKESEGQQQEKRLAEEIGSGRELQEVIKFKGSEFDQDLREVEKALNEVVSLCTTLEQDVMSKKKIIDDLEVRINQTQARIKQHEGEMYQTGIQRAQTDSTRQSLQTELQERYHLTIEEARETILSFEQTQEQMEREIRALRGEMDAAGDINMTSIEEFDKHKTRYEFLNKQIADLDMSKQELIAIITQLDGESRKIFKETFEKIRENFKKNFKILFFGGEADLEFTETGDVLEAGIEIVAKPPGKQMRSINLLSGGEKCLTALALLFAIFEVKPAPFCILDEIDAPLDDSNVERFVNVVKQFIDRCQFIIITHNKRTMAVADVLFGVSMEERGVSKLLSIAFSTSPEPVELMGS